MDATWYYSMDGKTREGPITQETLENMLIQGELPPEILVWSSSLSTWIRAQDVKELKIIQPPPLPGESPEIPSEPKVIDVSTSEIPARMEIRPQVMRNAILFTAGCLLFTIGGLWLIFSGNEAYLLPGLVGVAFFGGGWLLAFPNLIKRKVTMILTPEAIELTTPQGTAKIFWKDVESLGISEIESNKLAGIRLRSYDGYLTSMSPELAKYSNKNLPYLKLMARATSVLEVPEAVKLWSKLEGKEDISETLKSFGEVGTLAQALLWNRKTCNFDIVFSWNELDRSAEKFVVLLEQYRIAATHK